MFCHYSSIETETETEIEAKAKSFEKLENFSNLISNPNFFTHHPILNN